jgi:hypothetical protein
VKLLSRLGVFALYMALGYGIGWCLGLLLHHLFVH